MNLEQAPRREPKNECTDSDRLPIQKTPSIERIEKRFGKPAGDVIGAVAHTMTVQQMRDYLGVSNPTLVMKRLGIIGRTPSEAHRAQWQDPENASRYLQILRSQDRIEKHRKSLSATNNSRTFEQRKNLTQSARQAIQERRESRMVKVFGPNPYQKYKELARAGMTQADIAQSHSIPQDTLKNWIRYWKKTQEWETLEEVNQMLWQAVINRRLMRRLIYQGFMTKEEITTLKNHFNNSYKLDARDPIFTKLSFAIANVISVEDENIAAGITKAG